MQYRRFGRTNLQMPVFTTGGMRYQDGWQDKPLGEIDAKTTDNIEAILRRALEVGINHVETARGYGPSERQLGQVLPRFPREDLIVQTKIGPTDTGAEFLAHFEDSLDRLNLEYVDLLAIHGINTPEIVQNVRKKGGCLEAIRQLQKEGRVRWTGFSTHGLRDAIVEAVNIDDHGFDYINVHYYYIYQRNRPAIDAAMKRDMGVFIISPSDKGGMLYKPPAKLVDLCAPLHPMTFNDLWTLSQSGVHTLSLGAARPSDYDEHLAALPLLDNAEQVLAPILQKLGDAMEEVTGVRHAEGMSWDGVPEPYDEAAPEFLNIPLMLWLYNLSRGWDMAEYGKMRFNLLGGASHWFPGAKADSFHEIDPQKIADAVADSPFADQIPGLLNDAVEALGGEAVKRLSESS